MEELDPDGVHPDNSAGTASSAARGGHDGGGRGGDPGGWLCCLPCHWLRTNRGVHQASLSIATLLVTSVLVASPVLFLISSLPNSGVSPPGSPRGACGTPPRGECLTEGGGGSSAPSVPGAVCVTSPCREAAQRMLAAMAPSSDDHHSTHSHPCLDFYRYACAGWTHHQPERAFNWHTLQLHVELDIQRLLAAADASSLFRKLGAFYKSCTRMQTKTRNHSPMLSMVSELGGYLSPESSEDPDLTHLLGRLLLLDAPLLFDVYLDRDLTDPSRLAVFLDLPRRRGHSKLISPLEDENRWQHRFKRHSAKESRAYTYMMDSAQEQRLLNLERLLLQIMPSNMSTDVRAKELQTTLLFASTLNKIYPRMKDILQMPSRQDSFLLYNLTHLQDTFGFVDWSSLLEVLSNNFTESEQVYVVSPEYFFSVIKMLSHFPARVTHNALLALYARDYLEVLITGPTTPSDATGAPPNPGGLWGRYCSRLTTALFARPVGALYVQHFSPSFVTSLQHQIEEMFESIRQTMARRMSELSWLDDETRAAALDKLQAMGGRFLTWPQLWNRSYVAGLLDKVQVDPEDFFGNVIERFRERRRSALDLRDQSKWAFPFVVNAFYELQLNTLVVPLAVLTQPHFRADVPEYLRYASVGLVVAHEMLHGFDLAGAAFDARGRSRHWLTPDSRLRLEARLDCIVRQYSATFGKQVRFLGQVVDIQFDWNFTRNENMADISGLQVAYEAWRTKIRGASYSTEGRQQPRLPGLNLTASQLFFLVAAQTYCSNIAPEDYILLVELDFHTPYPERVNGVMLNSPAFAEAFKCPPGSPMNPTKKCSFW